MDVPADPFARAVVYVLEHPPEVDINEIHYRPTTQEFDAVVRLPRGSFNPPTAASTAA